MCRQRIVDTARTTLATPDEQRQAFIGHALTFALVIGGLAVLNLATSPHYPWFLWPLFGWGIGLVKQGLAFVQSQSAAGRGLTPDPSARPWPDLE